MGQRVLFVGARSGALAAARKAGVEAIVVDVRPLPPRVRGSLAGYAQVETWDDAAPAARAALDGARVDAVVALTERAVVPAARIRAALGVRGMDVAAAIRFQDKVAMKEAVRAAGIPCADFVALDEHTDADAVVDRLGLPLVVKERALSGSRGLVVARDRAAARAAIVPGLVAEQFIDGIEMSVESYVWGGAVRFVNTTEYVVPAFANLVPAALDEDTRAAVHDLNRRALEALGFEAGLTHLELFRTKDGCVFGEVAARPPGGRIMRLLRSAYGFNPWEALHTIALGGTPAFPVRAARVAAVRMLHPGPGVVRSVTGVAATRRLPGVHRVVCRVRKGSVVAPRVGTGQDVGWIEVRGTTRDEAVARLDDAFATLRIELG